MRRFTEQEDAKLKLWYRAVVPMSEIATRLQRHHESIRWRLGVLGLLAERQHKIAAVVGNKRLTAPQRIKALRKLGVGLRVIAWHLGKSHEWVRKEIGDG